MRFYLVFVLITSFAFSACSRLSDTPVEVSTGSLSATATPTPVPHAPEKIDQELERAIAEIAQAAKGKVGVGALLLETGDAAYLNRQEHFAMQSVYKLPIAMAAMKQVDNGAYRIDSDISITPADYVRRGFHSPIRNLNPQGTVMRLDDILRYSISESDGSANDVMLNIAGGPEKVQQYLSSIGIEDIKVADSTKTISMDWDTQYRNWATPEASVDLLKKLIDHQAGLSNDSTALVYNALSEADTGRHRIHRGLPQGAVLAHKTGTGGHPSEVPGYWKKLAEANANSGSTDPKTVAKNQKRPSPKRAGPSSTGGDGDSEESEPTSSEVISAVNDIGIITLPDGRHIILAIYINDSVSVNPDKIIADIAKTVCDRWTTGQIPDLREYQGNSNTRSFRSR
jgi:beta-lactamase class A